MKAHKGENENMNLKCNNCGTTIQHECIGDEEWKLANIGHLWIECEMCGRTHRFSDDGEH